MLPIMIGCASVYVVGTSYLLLQSFLEQQAKSQIGQNQIIVTPKSSSLGFLLGNKNANAISPNQITAIKNLPSIAKVFQQKIIQKPSSVRIDFLGNVFESDAPLFLIEPDLLEPSLQTIANSDFYSQDIPVFLSSDLLSILNSGLADSLGIPHLNENLLLGKKIKILIGYSSFVPNLDQKNTREVSAVISGFSSRVPLVGISLPERYFTHISGSDSSFPIKVNSLTLETLSGSDSLSIQESIEKMGLETDTLSQRLGKVQSNLQYILAVAGMFAAVLTLFALITIASIISADIAAQTAFIGFSRCFGARPRDIFIVFLMKLFMTVTLSFAIGIVIGRVAQQILLNNLFSQIINTSIHLPILLHLHLAFSILISSWILALLASLIPLLRATKISPITALQT